MSDQYEISSYVRNILAENNLEPIKILRYGPRFFGCVVHRDGVEGFFKMVLPIEERHALANDDYMWTKYDEVASLENRLVKEALFLKFFSKKLSDFKFAPQIIDMSETSPVWSLRTYINEPTMSAWDSDFVFSESFFETFTPREVIDFFVRLSDLSEDIPKDLSDMIAEFKSTLMNPGRFEDSINRLKKIPEFSVYADHLEERFETAKPLYADYKKVIAHYEPYPPHIFSSNGQMGLIDWENVGWSHQLQDLSVLYMRCIAHPKWQAEYLTILEEYGYFKGNGYLFWESELLIQSIANRRYFIKRGPIGTSEYDINAITFFENTIKTILTKSEYFKA